MALNNVDRQAEALDRVARVLLIAFLIGVLLGALTASAVIGLYLQ